MTQPTTRPQGELPPFASAPSSIPPKTPRLAPSIQGLNQAIETFKTASLSEISAHLEKTNQGGDAQSQILDWTLIINSPRNILMDGGNAEFNKFAQKEGTKQDSSTNNLANEIQKLGADWFINSNKLPHPFHPPPTKWHRR